MMAKSLLATGQPKEAMNYFNKSMKINPKHASALNNLGVSLYKFKYVKLLLLMTKVQWIIYLFYKFILEGSKSFRKFV